MRNLEYGKDYIKCRLLRDGLHSKDISSVSDSVEEVLIFARWVSEKDILESKNLTDEEKRVSYRVRHLPYTDTAYAEKVGSKPCVMASSNWAYTNAFSYEDVVGIKYPINLWDVE